MEGLRHRFDFRRRRGADSSREHQRGTAKHDRNGMSLHRLEPPRDYQELRLIKCDVFIANHPSLLSLLKIACSLTRGVPPKVPLVFRREPLRKEAGEANSDNESRCPRLAPFRRREHSIDASSLSLTALSGQLRTTSSR